MAKFFDCGTRDAETDALKCKSNGGDGGGRSCSFCCTARRRCRSLMLESSGAPLTGNNSYSPGLQLAVACARARDAAVATRRGAELYLKGATSRSRAILHHDAFPFSLFLFPSLPLPVLHRLLLPSEIVAQRSCARVHASRYSRRFTLDVGGKKKRMKKK